MCEWRGALSEERTSYSIIPRETALYFTPQFLSFFFPIPMVQKERMNLLTEMSGSLYLKNKTEAP